jgi:hypothetical protein
MLRKTVEQGRAKTETRKAVLAQAGSKSRSELRDLLATELQARGQRVPPQPLLDMQLDHILTSASPAGYASETVKGVKLLGDAVAGLVKTFRDTGQTSKQTPDDQEPERLFEEMRTRVMGDRNRTVQVLLAPDAQGIIAEAGNEGSWPLGGSSPVRRAELRLVEGSHVEVFLEDSNVGVLSDDDAQEFLHFLNAESNTKHRITVDGWRYKPQDEQWQLWLQLPDLFFRSFADPLACFVCGRRVSDDLWQNPNVWISRRDDSGGTSGRSVTAHPDCMEKGKELATAEGITWEQKP